MLINADWCRLTIDADWFWLMKADSDWRKKFTCLSLSKNWFEGFALCKKIDMVFQLTFHNWDSMMSNEIYIIQTSMSKFSQGSSNKFSENLTFFLEKLSLSIREVKEKLWGKSHTSRGEREFFYQNLENWEEKWLFSSKSHKSGRERENFLKYLESQEEKENSDFKFLTIEKRKRNENSSILIEREKNESFLETLLLWSRLLS